MDRMEETLGGELMREGIMEDSKGDNRGGLAIMREEWVINNLIKLVRASSKRTCGNWEVMR